MRFRELLNRAKTMDDTAMVQILELYNPLSALCKSGKGKRKCGAWSWNQVTDFAK